MFRFITAGYYKPNLITDTERRELKFCNVEFDLRTGQARDQIEQQEWYKPQHFMLDLQDNLQVWMKMAEQIHLSVDNRFLNPTTRRLYNNPYCADQIHY